MRPRFGLGQSDFRSLREEKCVYVDKTALIKDILDDGAQVFLVPRPRRFGKTLGLSMMRYWFERSDTPLGHLFEGLFITGAGEEYTRHFQRHPVIFISFKDVKSATWEEARAHIRNLIGRLYGAHQYLLDDSLDEIDVRRFQAVRDGSAAQADYETALFTLSELLHRHHGEKVLILVDEYDTPIHEGWLRGYYDRAILFFRTLFSSALKDNVHLFKAVITGILRVAKESLFSGLNNLKVCTILRPELATAFGFTEPEVESIIGSLGDPGLLPEVRRWYNGYVFGGHVIYNPWSVLGLANNPTHQLSPYWISTSSNDLLRQLLVDWKMGLSEKMEILLRGGTIEERIEDGVALREVAQMPDTIWSFLLFSGYLKAVELRREEWRVYGKLAIPNIEVESAFHLLFTGWLQSGLGDESQLKALLEALLSGDAQETEKYLDDLLLNAFSVHDTTGPLPEPPPGSRAARQKGTGKRPPPEQIYQAFILGLLVSLAPRYEVRSNRESGHGRYDVMILPKTAGQPGVVMELKVIDKRARETPKKALEAALRQIEQRDYAAELRARGATPIHEMGIVFEGKRAWVRKRA